MPGQAEGLGDGLVGDPAEDEVQTGPDGRVLGGSPPMLVLNIDNPVTPEIVREIEASPLILRAQLVAL